MHGLKGATGDVSANGCITGPTAEPTRAANPCALPHNHTCMDMPWKREGLVRALGGAMADGAGRAAACCCSVTCGGRTKSKQPACRECNKVMGVP